MGLWQKITASAITLPMLCCKAKSLSFFSPKMLYKIWLSCTSPKMPRVFLSVRTFCSEFTFTLRASIFFWASSIFISRSVIFKKFHWFFKAVTQPFIYFSRNKIELFLYRGCEVFKVFPAIFHHLFQIILQVCTAGFGKFAKESAHLHIEVIKGFGGGFPGLGLREQEPFPLLRQFLQHLLLCAGLTFCNCITISAMMALLVDSDISLGLRVSSKIPKITLTALNITIPMSIGSPYIFCENKTLQSVSLWLDAVFRQVSFIGCILQKTRGTSFRSRLFSLC